MATDDFRPEELQDLAKENTQLLVEFEYFTVLKTNGKKQEFGIPRDYRTVYDTEGATLSYVLPLKNPSLTRTLSLKSTIPPSSSRLRSPTIRMR